MTRTDAGASPALDAWITVLAGGIGSRFWPASTPERPKQLLPLVGPRSLFDDTLARATRITDPSRVRVLASAGLLPVLEPGIERAGAGAIIEPASRGTGPALVWAAAVLEESQPGTVMISMAADHRIAPLSGLKATLEKAVRVARDGYLCCIGVPPTRPDVGYGYVQRGTHVGPGSSEVQRFVEKPDPETARRYLGEGFLWNAGIFAWRTTDLLEAARIHAHELRASLDNLDLDDPEGFFDRAEPVAIDSCVMERADRVAVVEAEFEWDDHGVWEALARNRAALGAEGNVVRGQARLHKAEHNIVWTESRRATLIGVSDLVVVEANGEVLVMPRSEAGALNQHLRAMEENDGNG